jgi:methyl-accepting chemotaxis protein
MKSDKRQSIQFKHGQKTLKKFYIPLPNQRVMTIVLNLESQENWALKISIVLLGSILIALLVIFIMIRVITKRQLEPLTEIEKHLDLISKGDMTKKLDIREKNEWGWLADQINEMTQKISHLIVDIKKEIHSLLILSSFLSKQVNSSITPLKV